MQSFYCRRLRRTDDNLIEITYFIGRNWNQVNSAPLLQPGVGTPADVATCRLEGDIFAMLAVFFSVGRSAIWHAICHPKLTAKQFFSLIIIRKPYHYGKCAHMRRHCHFLHQNWLKDSCFSTCQAFLLHIYSAFANSCPASTDIFLFFIALSRYCRSSSAMFG